MSSHPDEGASAGVARLDLDPLGCDLHDGAFNGKLAALVFEQPRRFHQLTFVELLCGLRAIEQRQRRHHVFALAALG